MTWSYSGDPNASTKDAVRFYVGDTIQDDEQLQDEEINFLLADSQQDPKTAAAKAAEGLAALYARQIDKRVDRLDIHTEARMKHYQALATLLWSRAVVPAFYSGGIDYDPVFVTDTDLKDPFFTRHTDDYGPDPDIPERLQTTFDI